MYAEGSHAKPEPRDLTDWNLSKSGIPVDPQSVPPVGSFSYTFDTDQDDGDHALRLVNKETYLGIKYPASPTPVYVPGLVTNVDADEFGSTTVTASNFFEVMNVNKTVPAFSGTASAWLKLLFNTVGATEYASFVQDDVTPNPVVMPSWSGNVWHFLNIGLSSTKNSLSTLYLSQGPPEISVINLEDNPDFGYDKDFLIWNQVVQSPQLTADKGNPTPYVEVHYYNNKEITTPSLIYPTLRQGYNDVIQVDAGEVYETTLDVGAWVNSVANPVCIDLVTPSTNPGSTGVYCVSLADGRPLPAAWWNASGGSITTQVDPEDSSRVIVRIVAPSGGAYAASAPYRIAASGDSYYNSLRLVATSGVLFEDKSVRFKTGASDNLVDPDVEPTVIDLHTIATPGQAIDVAHRVSATQGGLDRALNLTVDYGEPEYRDNSIWIVNEWINRRFYYRNDYWVVSSVDVQSEGIVSISSVPFSQIEQFSNSWGSETIDDFNSVWLNSKFVGDDTIFDFNLRPLFMEQ